MSVQHMNEDEPKPTCYPGATETYIPAWGDLGDTLKIGIAHDYRPGDYRIVVDDGRRWSYQHFAKSLTLEQAIAHIRHVTKPSMVGPTLDSPDTVITCERRLERAPWWDVVVLKEGGVEARERLGISDPKPVAVGTPFLDNDGHKIGVVAASHVKDGAVYCDMRIGVDHAKRYAPPGFDRLLADRAKMAFADIPSATKPPENLGPGVHPDDDRPVFSNQGVHEYFDQAMERLIMGQATATPMNAELNVPAYGPSPLRAMYPMWAAQRKERREKIIRLSQRDVLRVAWANVRNILCQHILEHPELPEGMPAPPFVSPTALTWKAVDVYATPRPGFQRTVETLPDGRTRIIDEEMPTNPPTRENV